MKNLSQVPMEDEREELYTMAAKQALIGVCFVGIQCLKVDDDMNIIWQYYLKWVRVSAKIQRKHYVPRFIGST